MAFLPLKGDVGQLQVIWLSEFEETQQILDESITKDCKVHIMIDMEAVEEAQGVTQLYQDCGKRPGFNHKSIKSQHLVKFV